MYLVSQININELARKLGINWYTATTWVRNYGTEGLEAFVRHKNHTYVSTLKPLTELLRSIRTPILHSTATGGYQHTSREFHQKLVQTEMAQSMSRCPTALTMTP